MKFFYSTLFLLAIALGSCQQKQNNVAVGEDFKFSTQYDPIISCQAHTDAHLSFTVKVLKGDISNNKLTCTISGLPSGVVVTPQSMVVAQLLGGVFNLSVGTVPIGNYPFQLNISSPLTNTETHNLVLKVIPPPDYSSILANSYTKSFDYCQPNNSFYYYTSVVTAVADTPYKITISNLRSFGSSFIVRAWLSDVVTMPVQTIGAYTLWGTGTYSKDGRVGHENDYVITINDTVANGTDTQRCTVHLQH
jgi:hypothetical protein